MDREQVFRIKNEGHTIAFFSVICSKDVLYLQSARPSSFCAVPWTRMYFIMRKTIAGSCKRCQDNQRESKMADETVASPTAISEEKSSAEGGDSTAAELQKKIADAFDIFDHESNKTVDVR